MRRRRLTRTKLAAVRLSKDLLMSTGSGATLILIGMAGEPPGGRTSRATCSVIAGITVLVR